jgi:hypothetical protein
MSNIKTMRNVFFFLIFCVYFGVQILDSKILLDVFERELDADCRD